MDSVLIEADNLCLNSSTLDHPILDGIHLRLERGKIVTVVGPNGAGKTSLLRVLLGLRRADSGRVRLAEGLRLGYVPQRFPLREELPLTVARFLRLGQGKIDSAFFRDVLDLLSIADLQTRSMHAVSGGELQRVLLARALMRRPHALILDEPAQGVDVAGQAEFYRLLVQIRDRWDCAVLLVSHDLHFVMEAADEVLCLNRHVCCHGHPESVSQHPEYQKLFGGLPLDGLAVYQHHHDHVHDVHGNPQSLDDHSHG